MPSVEMIKTWESDEVITELRAAVAVLDEVDPPADLRGAVFGAAVSLLTQRIPVPKAGGIAAAPFVTH